MTAGETIEVLRNEPVQHATETGQSPGSALSELLSALSEKPSRAELLQAVDRIGLSILLDCRALRARLALAHESLAHLSFDWKDLGEGAEGEAERLHAIMELRAAEAGLSALGDAAVECFRRLGVADDQGDSKMSSELEEVVERLSKAPAGFVQRLAGNLRLMGDDPGLAEVIFRARRSLREDRLGDSDDEPDESDDDDEAADDAGEVDSEVEAADSELAALLMVPACNPRSFGMLPSVEKIASAMAIDGLTAAGHIEQGRAALENAVTSFDWNERDLEAEHGLRELRRGMREFEVLRDCTLNLLERIHRGSNNVVEIDAASSATMRNLAKTHAGKFHCICFNDIIVRAAIRALADHPGAGQLIAQAEMERQGREVPRECDRQYWPWVDPAGNPWPIRNESSEEATGPRPAEQDQKCDDDEVADDKGGADADQVHLPEGLEPFLYSSTERYIANARDYGGGFSEDVDICKVYISACVGEQEQYLYRRSIAGKSGTIERALCEINDVLEFLHLFGGDVARLPWLPVLPPTSAGEHIAWIARDLCLRSEDFVESLRRELEADSPLMPERAPTGIADRDDGEATEVSVDEPGSEGSGVSAAACGASAGREACGEPMMLHLCAQSGTSTEGAGESLFDLLVPETLIAALHSEIAQFAARWVRRCADQQLIEIGIGNEAAEAPEK